MCSCILLHLWHEGNPACWSTVLFFKGISIPSFGTVVTFTIGFIDICCTTVVSQISNSFMFGCIIAVLLTCMHMHILDWPSEHASHSHSPPPTAPPASTPGHLCWVQTPVNKWSSWNSSQNLPLRRKSSLQACTRTWHWSKVNDLCYTFCMLLE